MTHHRFRSLLLFLALLIPALTGLAVALRPAAAAPFSLSAQDVMAAVNELRRSQGLDAYTVDGGIAAYAQQHSEYQASIGQWTHTHSDGSSAGSRGYVENIAAGNADFLTAQAIVFEIWADAVHMKTMVGYSGGAAGVGVASSGGTVYVTLNVRAGRAAPVPTLPGGTPGSGIVYTPIALVPLSTATPKSNGAVIHEVGYGQSMWAIAVAYGVTGDRIRELNSMAPGQADIYAGQKLLIFPAGMFTPIPEASATPAVLGSSPQPVAMLATPTPRFTATRVQALTATPTPASQAGRKASVKVDPILAGLIGMATLGLILLLSSGVKINRHD